MSAPSVAPRPAALLAAASEPMPEVPVIALRSEGVLLIYGRDEKAIEAGDLLRQQMDVTVLIVPPAAAIPVQASDFPVVRGAIRSARGHLGAFEITVDDFAEPTPSSSGTLAFGPARQGAVSRCDVILDLSGGVALFSAPELRDGYVRADPGHPGSVMDAVSKTRHLTGTFDKPRYVAFTEQRCAHGRSQITGCTRCLDLCPAGAISPAGDHVAIDPYICAGCGQCAAACPTGAAAYTVPPADALLRKLRALLMAYRTAGGEQPIVLVHDERQGTPLLEALMQGEEGLPDRVLPFAVNEVTQVGLEFVAAAFAFGASALRFLLRRQARHDISGLTRTIEVAQAILTGIGFEADRLACVETDDPDILGSALRGVRAMNSASHPSTLLPMDGDKRSMARLILRELHKAAPAPVDVVALPRAASFGSVDIDVAGCTLCLACVSACPTGALADNADRPMLSFTESACVQCGLCKSTCPEKVITLTPQLDFRATAASPRLLKEEQPFCCIRCGKPFGVKSTIERVIAKLANTHWMYKDSRKRLELIKMCDDCRVTVLSDDDFDPHARPRDVIRTTDDYLREREERRKPADDEN